MAPVEYTDPVFVTYAPAVFMISEFSDGTMIWHRWLL